MMLRRRWFLILLALALCPVAGRAAFFGGENRAYNAAASSFTDAIWWHAEELFGQFATNYPKSSRVPEAILFQAEAQFNQAKYEQTIATLSAHAAGAGKLADEYAYWTGEAQFWSANYSAAAETFARVRRDFPASARLLDATVREAESRAKLEDWPQVIALLQETNGVFQRLAPEKPGDALVVHGHLLLAEAQLAQSDFAAAEAALRPLQRARLNPELDWQRTYLLCRAGLASERTIDSLACSSNLLSLAEASGRRDLRAESVAFQAGIFEKLNRLNEAIAVWTNNIATNAPVERQREALLKATELALRQNRLAEAIETLARFLQQSPLPAAADMALLTLGELHLKQFVAAVNTSGMAGVMTNSPAEMDYLQALRFFDRLVVEFPQSALVGKAELDRGWCHWIAGDTADSLKDFRAAAERLPPSEDLAVARFKLGEVLFLQEDYAGAAQNFRSVLDDFGQWPRVNEELADLALYRLLRASNKLNDRAGADQAMQRILESKSAAGGLAGRTLLLAGQELEEMREPERAREFYEQFIEHGPDSPLRAEVELAIVRTHEQQTNWVAAITNYDSWLARFPTNASRPQAEYSRAWANFQAGYETNALAQFADFVAHYQSNELALQAQWWIGDYWFRQGDEFVAAERSYRVIFQTWTNSELAGQAYLMAGLAAMRHPDYDKAISYFTNITSNLKYPSELQIQALLLYGGALRFRGASETNKPASDIETAIQVFLTIPQSITNEQTAQAWGEIGNCYLQLAADEARFTESISNASYFFRQVVTNSPFAGAGLRGQAQVGIGQALERQAERASGEEQKALRRRAMANYVEVFHGDHLRPGEPPDDWWRNRAGWEAIRLAEAMQDFKVAEELCKRLKSYLPQSQASLDNKIAKLRDRQAKKDK